MLKRSDSGILGVLKNISMSSIERANAANRSVVEYNPCSVDAFFDSNCGLYSALISGGNARIRNSAMVSQAICAAKNGFPVIVLHEGNYELDTLLRNCFSGTDRFSSINTHSPCFEPFYGLDDFEISSQIIETAPKEFDIKYNARYYLDGISALLKATGKNRTFKLFSSCPHSQIFDKVDEAELQGKITDIESREIKSKLMTGQSENYKLDTFFDSLKKEIQPILFKSKQGYNPINIISAIDSNSVLSFDISSVTNKILINTIFSQLRLALTKGMQYGIIIDSIPINSNESYASYMKSPSENVCKTISSDDLYSMVGGDEKLFASVVSESQIKIVMQHSSGHSAIKWAEMFGQYDKYEESYQTQYGSSRQTPFSIFSSPNHSRSVNVNKNREYVVKPEMISRMANGEAYILSDALGELAHAYLIN